jgi:2C-methyl-D-erythritol 2,4-cyclodiphosphate synthase
VPITDLLKYDVQSLHNRNWFLGNKVAQVLQQNTQLAQDISKAYETLSEKLKNNPIMALVTKTVATYMFIKHSNRANRDPGTEDFSSWGEPFFKE